MIAETRKTAQGTEYWDNIAKKTLFVPVGEQPTFEVTVDPKSMLENKEDKGEQFEINLDVMDAEQLLSFAKLNDIEVPGNMKKAETIREHIVEQLVPGTE